MHQKILRVQPSCCHDPTGDGLNKKLLSVTVLTICLNILLGGKLRGFLSAILFSTEESEDYLYGGSLYSIYYC